MRNSKAIIAGHTSKPSNFCLAAARISTTKGSALEIYNESMEKEDTSLIEKVLDMGHHSVSEHIYFNIIFDNVSVIVEQFIIEFRLASFTVKSRRYVDYKKMGFVEPELRFRDDVSEGERADLTKLYIEVMESLFSSYTELTDNGVPREDARFVLPYCFRSNFYCTVNARELMKIIYSACYGRGSLYPEIKNIGNMLLDQAKKIFKEPFSILDKIAGFKDNLPSLMSDILGSEADDNYLPEKKVELLSGTEKASNKMVLSQLTAHTGISTAKAEQIMENDQGIYNRIISETINDGRSRALENISFGFRINRITLAGLTHLVRHRIQSIIIPDLSRRVRFNDFIMPETITKNNDLKKIYIKSYEKHIESYNLFREKLKFKEDLFYFALAGMRVDIVTSMNARELFHFFRLRTCMRAQWEIRDYACEMLSLLRSKEPDIFKKVGPGCFMDGVCPEGKFSCKKMNEVRDFISKL
ncbi:MAG: FAD-dependent thymidylate synthase [Desulfobacteraceae bacterium]|nr:FAD-dependent thymidylate synthase [Desulfobacteraceae bacterium]MCB9495203.1 FAD-dependent thymidylate synthase [Desulfobacteraceae bacterium]